MQKSDEYRKFEKNIDLHIKSYLNRHYLLYGLSIIFSRGLELAVMFFAAKFLIKSVYGELEYYKKVLELGGVFLSFGFPTLILTYTRSKASKIYLLLFATIFVVVLSLLIWPILWYLHWSDLWASFLFYALFFTGGIYPVYVLVRKGSDAASFYKIGLALLFYSGVVFYILYSSAPSFSFVYTSRLLMLPAAVLLISEWIRNPIVWRFFRKYTRLFIRLLSGSLAVFLSNFTNMMFLYTDIFIIKWLSSHPGLEIADYGFSLNVANILMLIPFTLVQADIEIIKTDRTYFKILHKKILLLVLFLSFFLIPAYFLLISHYYVRFKATFWLFLIILLAKIFQSQGVLYGAGLLILRKYGINLRINLFMIITNIVLTYLFYKSWGLYGVAFASALSLLIRYFLLEKNYQKMESNKKL